MTQEVASVIEQIESGRLERSYKTNRQHVKHVKEIIEEKSKLNLAQSAVQKWCYEKLPKVKMQVVSFWGAAAFPKCRNVEAIF